MKQLILGTAGHVDHGKTTLIKALTGNDLDTHRQEKERGITINLGFTNLEISEKLSISVIDVPGHRDFVNKMVSGSSSIDVVLFVVAADSSVMPQTIEHLRILELLGVKSGVIAITRSDLIDEEMLPFVEEEVSELTADTFLKNAEMISVSAITGFGIDKLKSAIANACQNTESRNTAGLFRLFIDRHFTISGAGTVVTGSVLGGRLGVEETPYLFPGQKSLKLRKLEVHGREVKEIIAGNRASLNIPNFDSSRFKKGMFISNKILENTDRVDAVIKIIDEKVELGRWSSASMIFGTIQILVRIHLLNSERAVVGDEQFVQIEFPEKIAIMQNDRFILRRTSGDITIGGGRILDPFALKHRKRPTSLIESLSKISDNPITEYTVLTIKRNRAPIDIKTLSDKINYSSKAIHNIDKKLIDSGISIYNKKFYVSAEIDKILIDRLTKNLLELKSDPNEIKIGREQSEISGILGVLDLNNHLKFTESFLLEKQKLGIFDLTESFWIIAGNRSSLSQSNRDDISIIEDYIKKNSMSAPSQKDIEKLAKNNGFLKKYLFGLIGNLLKEKKIYKEDYKYIHADTVDHIRNILLHELKKNENGLTIAGFRDFLKGSRKIALALFSIYDKEGIIVRDGDVRKISQKGRDVLNGLK